MTARPTSVAILGGGYTGAAVAFHLARALPPGRAAITVFEPRPVIGAGLAYSATDPSHRINVPAARMSLISAEPAHFAAWLERSGALEGDPAAIAENGAAFPQRGLFGRYVREQLGPLTARGTLTHVAGPVERVERDGRRFRVATSEAVHRADLVVLAMTHPLPAAPAALAPVSDRPGFIANPYAPNALDGIGRHDRVLIVGNGLTGSDILASLEARGHEGSIVALSRHGLRSRGHPPRPSDVRPDFTSRPSRSALDLLVRTRAELAQAARAGLTWHPVLDALREQGFAVWTALPPAEQRRLARQLRAFWDVHRFRIAPQAEAAAGRLLKEGRLRVMAGNIEEAAWRGGAFSVSIRPRGARGAAHHAFDAVAIATGPAHGRLGEANPVIGGLHAHGLVAPDAVGLGLATAGNGLAIGAAGRPVPGLYIAGPLARGTVGELMGLPEVTRHAEFIAGEIARSLHASPFALQAGAA